MSSARRRVFGFTLIELMVVLAVVAVISLLAVPSFISFRQRSTLRGAAEQAQSFWNQARLEAAKRNSLVKVGVYSSSGQFCLGATTSTIDATDHDEPCNCLSSGACNIAVFPAIDPSTGSRQEEWRGVTLVGTPTLGENSGAAVIESRRTTLIDPDMAGAVTLQSPPGSNTYRLNLHVDRQGRSTLCESNAATDKMSDYSTRKCDP
jgi:prepilin-type N-terminal cleavage/methylation domain-containing protein